MLYKGVSAMPVLYEEPMITMKRQQQVNNNNIKI